MKAERWQQIEQLYQKARELEPKARLEFLKQACGDDKEFRQELESLLASDPKAGSFLERPTVETVATGVPEDLARSLVGRQLGWYEILSLLGVGGMGEVYRARDTKLNREIAIKVLPSAFAQDSDRLARFQREARMLASLNHPNIAAIYGLEELDGVRYLVLELVPGETLAQRLERHPLAVREALEICRQMAEALESAHEKGIIHRDLKPANVKVTPEGKVRSWTLGWPR